MIAISEQLTRHDLDGAAVRAAIEQCYQPPAEAAQYTTDGPACPACGNTRWAVNSFGQTWCTECYCDYCWGKL